MHCQNFRSLHDESLNKVHHLNTFQATTEFFVAEEDLRQQTKSFVAQQALKKLKTRSYFR